MKHNDFHGGYTHTNLNYERKVIDNDIDDFWPTIIDSKYGVIVRKAGNRFYIADIYKGFRVTPWRRISVLRLAELLAHYEAYTLAETSITLRLGGF